MAAKVRTRFELDGHRELKRLLDELPRRVVKKGLRQAMNAAATPIVKAARRDAPKVTGLLKRSISKKVKTYPNGNVAAIVGARKDVGGQYKGKNRIPYYYLHLIEGGVKPHEQKQGHHPGFDANPLLHRAFEGHKAEALQIAETKLKDVLETEAAKLGKK